MTAVGKCTLDCMATKLSDYLYTLPANMELIGIVVVIAQYWDKMWSFFKRQSRESCDY